MMEWKKRMTKMIWFDLEKASELGIPDKTNMFYGRNSKDLGQNPE